MRSRLLFSQEIELKLTLAASNDAPSHVPHARSDEERALIQKIAQAIDPDVWGDDIPVPTAGHTVAFHRRRIDSMTAAVRVMAAIEDDLKS